MSKKKSSIKSKHFLAKNRSSSRQMFADIDRYGPTTCLMAIYSGVHIRMDKPYLMKQMAYFWPSLVGNKYAIRLQPFRLHFSIDCSFKMRYCMTFYLNWHRNYERSNLELPNSLNKKHAFNFSLT